MIALFLTYLQRELNFSYHTVSSYRSDLLQWKSFLTDGENDDAFDPATVTSADMRAWVAELSSDGMSRRTIHRKVSAVSAFFRYLIKIHGYKANPASDLTLARIPHTLPIYVRPEEMKVMLDEDFDTTDFADTRDHLILTILYSTGMRSQELLDLLDINVDTDRGELKVHGKRNKDRIIPFGEEMKEMIALYRNLRASTVGSDSPTFFVLDNGKPLYRRLLYKIVHENMERAGIHSGRLSPHVLRHSFATDMLNAGAPLSSVSSLMGHESLASTQVYTHITYRELKQNYLTAHPRAQKKGENYGSKN